MVGGSLKFNSKFGGEMPKREASHQFSREFMFDKNVICDYMRHSTTQIYVSKPTICDISCIECRVIIRDMTCRICDYMRHVAVFRRESVVLQVSIEYALVIFIRNIGSALPVEC